MSIQLSTGSQVQIAATYGTTFTITAISNANPAVATLSASHGVVVGDYIEVNSGWDLLTGKVVRVSAVSVNDVTLEGINTSSTTNYPSGSGAGTGREIATWSSITQIQGVGSSGGDVNFVNTTTLADRTEKQIPTTRSATAITFTVFDDPTLSWYSTVQTASDAIAVTALRIIFPNGSRLVGNGYWSLQKTPNMQLNSALTHDISFSSVAESVRYAT